MLMVLVVGDDVSDLANINFATIHSIQSFDLLLKQNQVKDRLVQYLKPRQFFYRYYCYLENLVNAACEITISFSLLLFGFSPENEKKGISFSSFCSLPQCLDRKQNCGWRWLK